MAKEEEEEGLGGEASWSVFSGAAARTRTTTKWSSRGRVELELINRGGEMGGKGGEKKKARKEEVQRYRN